jgi:hypothetical protein
MYRPALIVVAVASMTACDPLKRPEPIPTPKAALHGAPSHPGSGRPFSGRAGAGGLVLPKPVGHPPSSDGG